MSRGSIYGEHRAPSSASRPSHMGMPCIYFGPSTTSWQKIPRWAPRSQRGVFVGLSTIHSSEVPLVLLNLETGSVTQQYHVVFDDRYSTVASINVDDKPPSDWEDLCLEKSLHVPTDDMPAMPPHLHDDWLTDAEREVKYRDLQRKDRARDLQHPPSLNSLGPVTTSPILAPLPGPTPSEGGNSPFVPTHPTSSVFVKSAISATCSGPIMGSDAIVSEPAAILALAVSSLSSLSQALHHTNQFRVQYRNDSIFL